MHSTTSMMMYGKCHAAGIATVYSTAAEPLRNVCDSVIETSAAAASSNKFGDIKTIFFTPEGIYRQMTISDHFLTNRVPLNQNVCPVSNTLVRVSLLRLALTRRNFEEFSRNNANNVERPEYIERICFNIGREIYVHDYCFVNGNSEFSKPIDKRIYKGTFPTCHDFNQATASFTSSLLLVGFTAGQIQLFDPYRKEEQSKLYNEDRSIDKSPVTHIRWIPGQNSLFMVAHTSGSLYVYNEEHGMSPNPPVYQLIKAGDAFNVHACKSKTPRNPVCRWTIGAAACATIASTSGGTNATNGALSSFETGVSATSINQFEFSPLMRHASSEVVDHTNDDDGQQHRARYLATAGQDGYLRVFDYVNMEPMGFMRSYFGGLLCLAWSPDGRLIATGGEDDMLTIYSVAERRVLCRGQGHKSWVSQVAFDPIASICTNEVPSAIFRSHHITKIAEPNGNGRVANENLPANGDRNASISRMGGSRISSRLAPHVDNHSNGTSANRVEENAGEAANGRMASTIAPAAAAVRSCYRLGSVGYDTQLCLWDLSEDVLASCDSPPADDAAASAFTNASTSAAAAALAVENGCTPFNNNNRTAGLSSSGMSKSFEKNELSPAPRSKALSPTDSADTNSAISQPSSAKSKFRKLHKRGLSFGSRFNDRWFRGYAGLHSASASTAAAPSTGTNGVSSRTRPNDESTTTTTTTTANANGGQSASLASTVFGSAQCPRIDDVPMVEPLVCKKIAHERLTVLQFRDDYIVTACLEGIVLTWARPGKLQSISSIQNNIHPKMRYYSTSSANAASDIDGTCI